MKPNTGIPEISILGTYDGEALDTKITNLNGMDITQEVFDNILSSEEYKRGIKYRWYLTYLGHPEDPLCADFERACCVLTDMQIKENGKVYVKMDLLNTPVGRIVMTLQNAGVVFGISIRGAGDLIGNVVDPDTFMFRGFDLVAFPAYPNSIPKFTAVAASTDPEQRMKYQKICAAVTSDINNINSCEAIEVLKTQFAPQSDIYKSLEERSNVIRSSQTLNIDKQKIEAITDMYLNSQDIIASKDREIRRLRAEIKSAKSATARKTSAIKRIVASQMNDIQSRLDVVTASDRRKSMQMTKLQKQLDAEKKSNLIYKQDIEATIQKQDADSKHKSHIIADLEAKMRKTVTASKLQERATSDLDATNRQLVQDCEALEANLHEYQDAYADIYANALGVSFNDLQVTSATTVKELQDRIAGATNSANICPMDVYTTDEDDDLVTL
jgi:hypothetical protein